MQKNLTLYLFVLLLAVLVLGGCNRSKGLDVKNVKMISYQLTGLVSEEESLDIKKSLESLNGVTAVAVNFKSSLAAITYYPDQINERKIKGVLNQTPGLKVADYKIKSDPNKPKCPAKGIRDWFSFNN